MGSSQLQVMRWMRPSRTTKTDRDHPKASRLILGTRTPSSAQRASARSDSAKKFCWQPNSRCALSADEGVRAPSNRRLLLVGYALLSLIALHDRENVSRRILEPGDRRPVIPVNPL